ncbi:MAG: metallophosphoesterase [Lunatimonas sp.]|uniref:metallophosphoesterase n=1 Tax=Lunatimonas sp. TaxID=2060141 RepID=UPI00263B5DD5|nr:metallophosphoesterase [Lunatimonas sp.]MCC5937985.1 metallophosphoesterase [Lunatimonas sp.]
MKFLSIIFMLVSMVVLSPSAYTQQAESPQFSFGVITDIQYADKNQVGLRNYRGSLITLENTVTELNKHELSFTVNLGDLIDEDFASYDKPMALLEKSRAKLYHVFGNHDYSIADEHKEKVPTLLGNPKGYHAFTKGNIQFVVLNGMDISLDGHREGSKGYAHAEAILADMNAAGANNAKPWNGGIGSKQFNWFRKVLKSGEKNGWKTVVFCHYPVLPENGLQLLNHNEVLRLISDSPGVVAYFSGHHHGGNYILADGVHHLTFYGMVESPTDALGAVVDVYADRLEIRGIGKQEDRVLSFR